MTGQYREIKQINLVVRHKVKFRRTVSPGDQLVLIAETIRVKSRSGHVQTRAMVGDELAAEAIIKFVLTDAPTT